jgi:hypothetical protein
MDAGWRVWQVQRSQEKVYFRPAAAAPVGVSDIKTPYVGDERLISIPRSSLRGSAMRLLEDYREGNGGTIAEAVATVLNGMAIERRRQLLERFPRVGSPSGADSAALIREDGDAR